MADQPEVLDLDERCTALSRAGAVLERLLAAIDCVTLPPEAARSFGE